MKKLKGSHERHGLKAEVQVPVGIETVILKASQDAGFKEILLSDRQAALNQCGFDLSHSESAMLSSMAPENLEAMIDRLNPATQKNKSFAKRVGTAAVMGGLLVASVCSESCQAAGIGPGGDYDTDTDSEVDGGGDGDNDGDGDDDDDDYNRDID